MNDQDETDRRANRNQSGSGSEFSQAMSRLEQAVQNLVTVTTGELGERATSVINETSKRLEAELRLKRATGKDPNQDAAQDRRSRRNRTRHQFTDDVASQYSSLYIDKADEKIAGVCAAFARYFGVENWVVRMAALTGLVFIPQIVFPGYWIAYFVIEKRHSVGGKRRRRRSFRSRHRRQKENLMSDDIYEDFGGEMPPEPDPRQPDKKDDEQKTSRDLRHVTTDLTQAELRLRRLESFVTSDQYELHKELAKIDPRNGTRS